MRIKDEANNLAKELGTDLELCENLSKVSVVYKDSADANKMEQKISSLLSDENISTVAEKALNSCKTVIVKEDGEKSVRVIFDGYFK